MWNSLHSLSDAFLEVRYSVSVIFSNSPVQRTLLGRSSWFRTLCLLPELHRWIRHGSCLWGTNAFVGGGKRAISAQLVDAHRGGMLRLPVSRRASQGGVWVESQRISGSSERKDGGENILGGGSSMCRTGQGVQGSSAWCQVAAGSSRYGPCLRVRLEQQTSLIWRALCAEPKALESAL